MKSSSSYQDLFGIETARVTPLDIPDYEIVSNAVIENLNEKGFNAVIFDFDGTLTKSHTAREGAVLDASRDWFADKTILEKILQKGFSSGIKFYIASNQRQEIVESILEENELKDYFTEIHSSGVRFIEKSAVIDAIAQNIEHNRVLYLDDDAEQFRSEKITTITDLLTPLSHRENSRKRDINGEAGLTLEKWQQVLTCLQTENYAIKTTQSISSIIDTLPSFSAFSDFPLTSNFGDRSSYANRDLDSNSSDFEQLVKKGKNTHDSGKSVFK